MMDVCWNLGMISESAGNYSETALIDLSTAEAPRRYTYHDLNLLICWYAQQLTQLGLKRGARVAILSANSAGFLAAYLGIMRAGFVAVPVNYKLPVDKVHFILGDCGADVVLSERAWRSICPESIFIIDIDDVPATVSANLASACCPDISSVDDDAAVILYTSGSSGAPKGVVHTHSAYLWTLRTRLSAYDYSSERFLVAAPLYHMNALNTVKLALAGHASIVLMPQFSTDLYARAIDYYRCTWLTVIPTMIALLYEQETIVRSFDLSSVHMVRLGSEPVTQRIIDSARMLFPYAAISNGYGTTEIGSVVFGAHPDGLPTPPLSLGYPHPSVCVRLVNRDSLDANEGELQVQTPALMKEYHGLPAATASAMTSDRYFNTRDLVRRDKIGFHYFVGRSDDMFVCGGENIYPGDIEKMLERHQDVVQACIVPLADPVKGFKPVALIVKRVGARLEAQEVKEYALQNGPANEHPRAVYFVARFPVSGAGKMDRKAAAALAERLGH